MPIDPLSMGQVPQPSQAPDGSDLRRAAARGDTEALETAARQFETYFVQEMLSSMRSTTDVMGSDLLDSSATDTWTEQLDAEVAKSVAQGPGLGLARMIVGAMEGTYGRQEGTYGRHAVGPAEVSGVRRSGWSWPLAVPGSVSSGFGSRRDPVHGEHRHHGGLDIAAPAGTPILAAAPGRVLRAGPAGGYGLLVEIEHADGIVTRYAHQQSIDVAVGQEVDAGARIGKVGSTGRSTGPHLHLEVRRDGEPVDPWAFLGHEND